MLNFNFDKIYEEMRKGIYGPRRTDAWSELIEGEYENYRVFLGQLDKAKEEGFHSYQESINSIAEKIFPSMINSLNTYDSPDKGKLVVRDFILAIQCQIKYREADLKMVKKNKSQSDDAESWLQKSTKFFEESRRRFISEFRE